eukprot:6325271-Prymnesium_polylepis.2
MGMRRAVCGAACGSERCVWRDYGPRGHGPCVGHVIMPRIMRHVTIGIDHVHRSSGGLSGGGGSHAPS